MGSKVYFLTQKAVSPVCVCTVDCKLWDALVQAEAGPRPAVGSQVGQ